MNKPSPATSMMAIVEATTPVATTTLTLIPQPRINLQSRFTSTPGSN